MEEPLKRSEILEREYSQSLIYGLAGVGALILAFLLLRYSEMFSFLGYLFLLAWLGLWGYAGWRLYQLRSVPQYPLTCPYCKQETIFAEPPSSDFSCDHCLRRVPVEKGQVLEVFSVRCPHCGSTQQLSARAAVALCEECNHEIVLARAERVHLHHFAATDDETTPCELVLLSAGRDPEPLIQQLESLLAINRPSAKRILEQLPMVLLSGIPKRKAEILRLHLLEAGAQVELRVVQSQHPEA